MNDLPNLGVLSPIWVAALKSPIQQNSTPLIPFKFREADYLLYRPPAVRTIEVPVPVPVLDLEPNFEFSHHTFAARVPFWERHVNIKKPEKTALEELRAALVRCYEEDISVDRMQAVWNFELTQSVMGD